MPHKLRLATQIPGLILGFILIGILTIIIMVKDVIDLLREKEKVSEEK